MHWPGYIKSARKAECGQTLQLKQVLAHYFVLHKPVLLSCCELEWKSSPTPNQMFTPAQQLCAMQHRFVCKEAVLIILLLMPILILVYCTRKQCLCMKHKVICAKICLFAEELDCEQSYLPVSKAKQREHHTWVMHCDSFLYIRSHQIQILLSCIWN